MKLQDSKNFKLFIDDAVKIAKANKKKQIKFTTNPKLLDKVKRQTDVEPSGTNVLMCIAFVFIFLLPTINAIIKLNF